MSETWKPLNLEGFKHLYEVSDIGRVRSVTHKVKFGAQSRISYGKILACNSISHKKPTTNGYRSTMISVK